MEGKGVVVKECSSIVWPGEVSEYFSHGGDISLFSTSLTPTSKHTTFKNLHFWILSDE